MLDEQRRNPEVKRRNEDPYALNPAHRHSGLDGPDVLRSAWDADFKQWTGPFIMANVDTRVVRRSNALLDNAYGADFRYDEAMLTGRGPVGFAKAVGLATVLRVGMAALSVGPRLAKGPRSRLARPGTGTCGCSRSIRATRAATCAPG